MLMDSSWLFRCVISTLTAYRRMASMGAKIWREHGALEFRECVGDDMAVKMGMPFPRMMKIKPNETVVFSWITFKSRAHRGQVQSNFTSSICNPDGTCMTTICINYGTCKTMKSISTTGTSKEDNYNDEENETIPLAQLPQQII
jgi:uncharacterized protein YbaA (DUF1428 family)